MKGLRGLLFLTLAVADASVTAWDCHHDIVYHGSHHRGVEVFWGIRYGEDTGGHHRFRPPRAHRPEKGSIVFATDPRPVACPQPLGSYLFPLYLGNVSNISEDCLFLNIQRPNGTLTHDRLPVHVHIHGGSFIAGSKDDPALQPPGLILQSVANGHPVMQVNVDYRLGVFGFARSDALISGKSANAGLRDQRLALQWVQDHISAFGGDPRRVTVSGQSSGGLAVGMQLMAYGGSTPAPFHQAICESQALEPAIASNLTKRAFERVARNSSCDASDLQSEATLACLRSLSTKQILDAQTATLEADQNLGDVWLPAVDGDFLPAAPSELIRTHRFNNVTTMIGWCEDDTQFFIDDSVRTARDTRDFLHSYLPGVSAGNLDELLKLYPSHDSADDRGANHTKEFYRAGRIQRDILMTCEPFFYGRELAAAGNIVYFFVQNQTVLTPLLDAMDRPGLGVVHTSDFAYIFDNIDAYDLSGYPFHPSAADYALAQRQARTWSAFLSTGQPSLRRHDTFHAWTAAFPTHDQIDIFVAGGPSEGLSAIDGHGANAALESQKLRERCAFINSPGMIEQLRF